MGDRTYSFDANLQLSDNSAAYGATGFAQVGGAQGLIDLGGNQGTTPKQQARTDAALVLDVTAIKTSSGNETYKVILLGSNDPAFGAGNVEMLGEIMLGAAASRDGINMLTSTTGRYELFFTNEQANVKYEYLTLYLVIGGTTPTINLLAFVGVLVEP